MLKLNSVGILMPIKTTAMTTLLVIFKHIIKYRWLVHYLNQIGKGKKKPKKSHFPWKGQTKYMEQAKEKPQKEPPQSLVLN